MAIWERYGTSTLLETACSKMASLDTLELLTSARPSIPEDSSALSVLWQSYCKRYGDDETFVQVLQSGTTEAFDIGCKFQLLLKYLSTEYLLPCSLHTAAASEHCSLELFKLFCGTLRDEVSQSFHGRYPIHCALQAAKLFPNQRAKAEHIIQDMPEQHSVRDEKGRLPLHLALQVGLVDDENMMAWIVKSSLDSVDPSTGLNTFQIAALASPQAPVSVLFELLRGNPQILVDKSKLAGNKIFEIADEPAVTSSREYISPMLRTLLTAAEAHGLYDELIKTLRAPVDDLWHQLIGATQLFCPPKLVELLISMHPEMLLQPDQRGMLPLHHAVSASNRQKTNVLTMILNAAPTAARYKDKSGRTPFHMACLENKGTWIIDLLRSYHPEAIYELDRCHKLPPVFLVAQSPRGTLDTIFYLLTLGPDVLCRY